MAIPSGSGTEVLKRNSVRNQAQTFTAIDWALEQTAVTNSSGTTAVPAHNIITLLSIVWNNNSSATSMTSLKITASGRDDITLYQDQAIPAWGSFVFNDKVVLHPGDILSTYASQNTNIWITYIRQDWS